MSKNTPIKTSARKETEAKGNPTSVPQSSFPNGKKEAKVKDKAPEAEEDEDEEGGKPGMAKTLQKYRPNYRSATSYNGRKSAICGDDLSSKLEGRTPAEVLDLAERVLGLEKGELRNRYASLNPGQQRMNGGNRIRAAIKRGDITMDDVNKAIPRPKAA